jgi:GNAT superfamily N-acetyltransferase
MANIRELLHAEDPAVPGMLELFIETFDAWAREPIPTVVGQLRNRAHGALPRHWVCEIDGQVVGLVRGQFLPSAGCGIIVHLGLSPHHRSAGLGPLMIEAAEHGFREDAAARGVPYQGVLFEVERIEDGEDEHARKERSRRLAFFAKNGCKLLTSGYVQPSLADHLPAMPLNLLLKPAADDWDTASIISQFYAEFWNLNGDHEYVARAMEHINTSPTHAVGQPT